MNIIHIHGNITRDVELRQGQNGNMYCYFTVACQKPFKNKETGEYDSVFIDVLASGTQAETVSKYFSKGQPIIVTGWLDVKSKKQENGGYTTSATVVMDRFEFVRGGGKREKAPSEGNHTPRDKEEEIPSAYDPGALPFDL